MRTIHVQALDDRAMNRIRRHGDHWIESYSVNVVDLSVLVGTESDLRIGNTIYVVNACV